MTNKRSVTQSGTGHTRKHQEAARAFQALTAAIRQCHAAGHDHAVNILLAAKTAALRYHGAHQEARCEQAAA